jgi:hypothetical protein
VNRVRLENLRGLEGLEVLNIGPWSDRLGINAQADCILPVVQSLLESKTAQ